MSPLNSSEVLGRVSQLHSALESRRLFCLIAVLARCTWKLDTRTGDVTVAPADDDDAACLARNSLRLAHVASRVADLRFSVARGDLVDMSLASKQPISVGWRADTAIALRDEQVCACVDCTPTDAGRVIVPDLVVIGPRPTFQGQAGCIAGDLMPVLTRWTGRHQWMTVKARTWEEFTSQVITTIQRVVSSRRSGVLLIVRGGQASAEEMERMRGRLEPVLRYAHQQEWQITVGLGHGNRVLGLDFVWEAETPSRAIDQLYDRYIDAADLLCGRIEAIGPAALEELEQLIDDPIHGDLTPMRLHRLKCLLELLDVEGPDAISGRKRERRASSPPWDRNTRNHDSRSPVLGRRAVAGDRFVPASLGGHSSPVTVDEEPAAGPGW